MKKIKSAASIFLSMVLFVTCFSVSAFAADSKGPFYEEAVYLECTSIPDDAVLLDTQTFYLFIDNDGNPVCLNENQIVPYSNTAQWTGPYHKEDVRFYKSGSTYYVGMTAEITSDSPTHSPLWFTNHTLKIRPKNNNDWFEHDYPHETKPRKISDTMSFHYPNGEPSSVTVEVKGSITIGGEGILDYYYSITSTATLDNPGKQ